MQSHRASTGSDADAPRSLPVRLLAGNGGQGTVEYALVLFAFTAVVVGLGALWHLFDSAAPVQHALQSASHHVEAVAPGAFADVFMY